MLVYGGASKKEANTVSTLSSTGTALATVSLAGPVETEQGKKPFIDPLYNSFGPKCLADNAEFPRDSEACLGTRDYCGWKKYEAMGEHFDSPKSCMDSRQPPLFKEPASEENQANFCEGNPTFKGDAWRATTEPCLGTVAYCNKKAYEGTGETYDNPDECITLRVKTLTKNASLFQPLLDGIHQISSAKVQQGLIDAIPKCKTVDGGTMERPLVEIECPKVS